MPAYKNNSGDSGVTRYRIAANSISVWFASGEGYLYSYKSAGMDHVEGMKDLAHAGKGLATYINKYVRDKYEKRL